MLQNPMMHFNGVYFFQQCVVFLMWMGLMKVALGELKAILKEEREPHAFLLQHPTNEPCQGIRRASALGGRETVQSVWMSEAEMPPRARVQVGGCWRGAEVP